MDLTPAAAIADLDAQLATDGHDIVVQRVTGGTTVAQAVTMRAFVRGYQPQELVNGITQQDAKVILSPTGLATFNSGAAAGLDVKVPIKGNKMVINGKTRSVEAAVGIYMAGTLVRVEARVLG